ncbi:MAG TPA: hypothetical protein VGI48_11535 [Caldimonas sp.]|jgi:hypothetical protein
MRESLVFEVHLRRFWVWRSAVGAVAFAAVATVLAWGFATSAAHDDDSIAVVLAVATVLTLATVAVAVSLARVPAGVLACRDGEWTFASEAGPSRSGPMVVAIDWGSFLLLRIDAGLHARVWLPVQRRGLERDWHALRCAVYSAPRRAGTPAQATAEPPQ